MSTYRPSGYCGATMRICHSGNRKLSSSGATSATSSSRPPPRSGTSRNSQKLSAVRFIAAPPSHQVAPAEAEQREGPGQRPEQQRPADAEQETSGAADALGGEAPHRAEARERQLRRR